MKLFKIKNCYEGEINNDRNVFLIFGKSYLSDGSYDGWKIFINFPIKSHKVYYDPDTFHKKEGLCTLSTGLWYRFKYKKWNIHNVWFPIKGEI